MSVAPVTAAAPMRPANSPSPFVTTVPPIAWREISSGLWVGRADDLHVGMIERGHRFRFTDAAGVAHSGFKTLTDAQDAATGPIPVLRTAVAHSAAAVDQAAGRLPMPFVASIGVVGAGVIALCGFAFTFVR